MNKNLPAVTTATPTEPESLETASAAKTAEASFLTSITRIFSFSEATNIGDMWPPVSVKINGTLCAYKYINSVMLPSGHLQPARLHSVLSFYRSISKKIATNKKTYFETKVPAQAFKYKEQSENYERSSC